MIKKVRRQSIEFENTETNIFLPSAYIINYHYWHDRLYISILIKPNAIMPLYTYRHKPIGILHLYPRGIYLSALYICKMPIDIQMYTYSHYTSVYL
jgi:hypothetical protein